MTYLVDSVTMVTVCNTLMTYLVDSVTMVTVYYIYENLVDTVSVCNNGNSNIAMTYFVNFVTEVTVKH